ncbi:MAG: hypothetical protein WCE75_08025 [Terracidiphilus sp.]
MTLLRAMVFGWAVLPLAASAQTGPDVFPLAGDWQGVMEAKGAVDHLILHMNTTPEGKITALVDFVDRTIEGVPAIGGSFDGTRLVLRFFYWKPSPAGDHLDYKVSSYEATVSPSGDGMTGVWNQEGSFPLNFKRLTWQARNPKPAKPTAFDGDWAGIEYENKDLKVHFILHVSNTEDGLAVFLDCPDERFKGAKASKITYDQDSRQISFKVGAATWTGKMTADGKALDTVMTEPGYRFEIHFDRQSAPKPQPH